jgi:hypothetical protein
MLKSSTLVVLTTFTVMGCAFPPVGTTDELISSRYLMQQETLPKVGVQQDTSPRSTAQANDRFVSLGTASIATNNIAVTQTWFIDNAINKLVVCSAIANVANLFCRAQPLPIQ